MGKRAYIKCKEVVEQIIKDGITKDITGQQMKSYLMKYVGADDRTLNRYILFMKDFGFVKIVGMGVFQITNEVNT
jgi:hypothetical protein